ncbi:MAG TPA: hypothetical protein VI756_12245, partial [Blastocatellia bacterium]
MPEGNKGNDDCYGRNSEVEAKDERDGPTGESLQARLEADDPGKTLPGLLFYVSNMTNSNSNYTRPESAKQPKFIEFIEF